MTYFPGGKDRLILKNSSSYLIFRYEEEGRKYVCKIANKNNDKLVKEVTRVKKLKEAYPKLGSRLPEIVASDIIQGGIHGGKRYYVQNNFSGSTFSQFIQSCDSETPDVETAFLGVTRALLDMAEEHVCSTAYEGRSGDFLKNFILEERKAIGMRKNMSYIALSDELVINGRAYPSIDSLLIDILCEEVIAPLNQGPSFISTLGHWNFHADNVILAGGEIEEFKVIDPDTSIDVCDPLFGVARFMYSFPHDSAVYNRYVIHSNIFGLEETASHDFNIEYLWPQAVYESYARYFNSIYAGHEPDLIRCDDRLGIDNKLLRLKLCFLLCLLRGVNANYFEEIDFMNRKLTEFQNKSIFLFLQAILFATNLRDDLYGQSQGKI